MHRFAYPLSHSPTHQSIHPTDLILGSGQFLQSEEEPHWLLRGMEFLAGKHVSPARYGAFLWNFPITNARKMGMPPKTSIGRAVYPVHHCDWDTRCWAADWANFQRERERERCVALDQWKLGLLGVRRPSDEIQWKFRMSILFVSPWQLAAQIHPQTPLTWVYWRLLHIAYQQQ